MQYLKFAFLNTRPALRSSTWTCRKCLLQTRATKIKQIRGFATKGKIYGQSARPKRKGTVLVVAAGGAAGVSTLAFTDDVKYAYEAVERTGRVVSTLFICINE